MRESALQQLKQDWSLLGIDKMCYVFNKFFSSDCLLFLTGVCHVNINIV
jgi:hypothetical protein